MANAYDVDDGIRLSVAFTVSDVNTDPTTVTLKVQEPDGTETPYTYTLAEVTKSAVGVYYKDIIVDSSGAWFYRWEGTGTVVAATEEYFHVRTSEFS